MPVIILPVFLSATITASSAVLAYEDIDGYNPGRGDLKATISALSSVNGNASLDNTLYLNSDIVGVGNLSALLTDNLQCNIGCTSLVGAFFTYGDGRGYLPRLEGFGSTASGVSGYGYLPSIYSEAAGGWYIPPDAVGGYAILTGLTSFSILSSPNLASSNFGPMVGQGWVYTVGVDEVFIPPIFLQAGISAVGNIVSNEQINGRYNNELLANITSAGTVYGNITVDGITYLAAVSNGVGDVTGASVITYPLAATIVCESTFNPSNDLGQFNPWDGNGGGVGYLRGIRSFGFDGERLVAQFDSTLFGWNPFRGLASYTANFDGSLLISDSYISLLAAAIVTETLPTSALTASSSFTPYTLGIEELLETLNITSTHSADRFVYNQFVSTLNTSSVVEGLRDVYATFAGSLTLADTIDVLRSVIAEFLSTLTFDDTVSALAAYQATFDGLMQLFDSYVPIIGTTAAPLAGVCATWVVNVDTQASTQYDRFNFNSYTKRGSDYLAAAEDGIYKLTGDTDAGSEIAALIDLAVSRFATPQRKYFPSVYLGVTSTGKLLLKAEVDGQTWIYEAKNETPNMSNQRVDLGRGLVGSHWRFYLLNQTGLDFELESVEFLPYISTRRVY